MANITEKDLNDVLEVLMALENLSIENACARMIRRAAGRTLEGCQKF